ncbi:HupE/UreJ family protein [Hufsiella ginkgonis]|uniref:HupE/UreJ family protein n=1 Tax=Hufsiella ginkgonis TaxID=2695274 RepID=A0A7K1XWF0_9SPHI|nr:HupE/UreJ family protein [Hufsiella ginkgonis]MXV15280.1 HupE/UreJ family protein [Hufsiella ginkgonis]
MADFNLYFTLGWQHICDWKGFDHILFVMVLCVPYALSQWKKVLVLVTAFTVGHSITLALSTLSVIHVNTSLIEFLIPLTIVFTSLFNILWRKNTIKKPFSTTTESGIAYLLALFFGLIHGLGFSTYLKSLLGSDYNVIPRLLAFNVGLEAGQLCIVTVTLLVSWFFVRIFKTPVRDWILFLSSAIFGLAAVMAAERISLIKF